MWKGIFKNVKMCPRSLVKMWTLQNLKTSDNFWENKYFAENRCVFPRVTLLSIEIGFVALTRNNSQYLFREFLDESNVFISTRYYSTDIYQVYERDWTKEAHKMKLAAFKTVYKLLLLSLFGEMVWRVLGGPSMRQHDADCCCFIVL